MFKQRALDFLPLASAFMMLVILTLQYPLSTSFPIGGDAGFYVRVSRTLLASDVAQKITILKNAPYPLAYVAAASSVVLPLDWPERFTWLVTITYVLVGACLGFLLYRLNGPAAAATSLAVWALVPIGITSHIEAGTFAQLMSLAFLALFFERLNALSRPGVLLTYLATVLAHPLTGLVLVLTVLTVVVAGAPVVHSFPRRQRQIYWLLFGLTILSLGAVVFKLWVSPVFLTTGLQIDTADFSLPDLIRSQLAPWLIVAPLGFIYLAGQPRANPLIKMALLVFCITTVLLSFNYLLGVGLWTYRFQSYFVVGTVILSSLAFPWLMRRVFGTWFLGAGFVSILFVSLSLASWRSNDRVFRYYEAPGNYARLHPAEYDGIRWLQNNVTSDSVIITSNVNRHAEWIPALTQLQWLSLSHLNDEVKINDKLREARVFGRPVYMALFLNAEEVPAVFPSASVIFVTSDFMVIRVRE